MVPAVSALDAVEALVAELRYPPSDPRAAIAAVALVLAAELDRAPSAGLARELRADVDFIAETPNEDPTVVDEIRARRAQRRAQVFLGAVAGVEEGEGA